MPDAVVSFDAHIIGNFRVDEGPNLGFFPFRKGCQFDPALAADERLSNFLPGAASRAKLAKAPVHRSGLSSYTLVTVKLVTGATTSGNFSTVTLAVSSPNPLSSERLTSFTQK